LYPGSQASDLQLHEIFMHGIIVEIRAFLQGTGHPKHVKKSLKTQISASFFRPFLDFFTDDRTGVLMICRMIKMKNQWIFWYRW
jgi:hypothetical protein